MVMHYFKLGGDLMWPLLACSIYLVAVLIERTWTVVWVYKVQGRAVPTTARDVNERLFAFFKDIPTGIGLLGTVIGIVQCFGLTQGQLTVETAAGGLGVACFTTILGLSVAIPAAVFEHVFGWLLPRSQTDQGGAGSC